MVFILSEGFSISYRKLAQVGLEPTTSCLPYTCSNHSAIWQLITFAANFLHFL